MALYLSPLVYAQPMSRSAVPCLLLCAAVAACVEPTPSAVLVPALVTDPPRALGPLVITAIGTPTPVGGEGPTRYRVAWGVSSEHRFDGEALAAVRFGDAAVVLDAAESLWRFTRDGRRMLLASGVTAPPAVDHSETLLAYFVGEPGEAGAIFVVDARQTRVVVAAVRDASALRFVPDASALLFLATGPGGVAGVHRAAVANPTGFAQCLSNCELRAGEPWGDAFVPLPTSLEGWVPTEPVRGVVR